MDTDIVPQTVSGPSLQWALIALALTAMSQRSWCADHLDLAGELFHDVLTPHRASPIICMADTIAELVQLVRYSSLPGAGEQLDGNRTMTNVMKLLLFLLGAVPQAIKLFALQGVPAAQVCAGIYLFSMVVHALFSLLPEKKVELSDTDKDGARSLLLSVHLMAYCTIWSEIMRCLPVFAKGGSPFVDSMDWFYTQSMIPTIAFWTLALLLIPAVLLRWSTAPSRRVTKMTMVSFGTLFCFFRTPAQIELIKQRHLDAWSVMESARSCMLLVPVVLPSMIVAVGLAWPISWTAQRILGQVKDVERPFNKPEVSYDEYLDRLKLVPEYLARQQGIELDPQIVTELKATIEAGRERDRPWHNKQEKYVRSIRQRLWAIAYVWDLVYYACFLMNCASIGITQTELVMTGIFSLQPLAVWLGFLIYNLATLVTYYNVVFDGTKTWSPQWLTVLG